MTISSPKDAPLRTVGISGTGAVASALCAELVAAGVDVALWGRDLAAARALARTTGASHAPDAGALASADVVVLAVSDGAAAEVAGRVLEEVSTDAPPLFHTSGPASGREGMGDLGGDVGSLHPLVAVPRAARDGLACGRFRDMPFALESTGPAGTARGQQVIDALGANAITIEGEAKLRYHALATMVATGVVALVDRAASTMAESGDKRDAFRRAYAALASSAAANLEELPGPEALTGALARGDEALVERHRAALASVGDAAPLYDAITRAARAMLAEEQP